MGGLGISDPRVFASAAVISSWLSSLGNPDVFPSAPPLGLEEHVSLLAQSAPSLGVPLASAWSRAEWLSLRNHPLFPKWKEQASWTEELEDRRCAAWDSEVDARLSRLRRLQAAPHSGLWLLSTPLQHEWDRFSPSEWQLLLCYRSGVPLAGEGDLTCACCGLPMDRFGDHALSCASAGRYRRHNRVRKCLFGLATNAGWAPELEVQAPGRQERPADVLVHTSAPKPLAVDVTVVHPLRPSNNSATRDDGTFSAEAAEKAKSRANAEVCKEAGWVCQPFGVETTGGLGPKADALCRSLARSWSMGSGRPVGECAHAVRAALSTALAKGWGEMLCASFRS